MAINPNPKLYNAADNAIITAINFGTGSAGGYKPDADGTESVSYTHLTLPTILLV